MSAAAKIRVISLELWRTALTWHTKTMIYPRLDRATVLAAQWHAGTERDGDHPLPYIVHPIEVLSNLRYVGRVIDEDLLCVAILHDVLEETTGTAEAIEEAVGNRVRELVVELTRKEPTAEETVDMTKPEIWQLRSKMLLSEIEKMSSDAQQVKLADRLSNVQEAKRTKSKEKLERYLAQTKKILKIVDHSINPYLWEAIADELK